MQARNLVFLAGHALSADVGTPQVENLVQPTYQSGILSDKVATGRAKSALNSEQVPGIREIAEAPLEGWSRGCRRAHVSFWFWLRLQLWLLAPRRPIRPPSRSARKSWTPASTSNLPERACRRQPGGPAPIPATPGPAVAHPPKIVECNGRPSYAAGAFFRISEDYSCLDFPLQCFVHWPCFRPVLSVPTPSCPSPSTISSEIWKMSASAMNSCATRTTSRLCARFRAVRIVARKANGRPSPSPDNGRSACLGRTMTTTIRIRRIRSARPSRADLSGPPAVWAAAPLSANGPCDCTDRSKDQC